MKKLLPVFALFVLLFSCNKKRDRFNLLSPGYLKIQEFSLNPDRDTILITNHAGVLRIAKGTFPGNKKVQIEIKEAYTPTEIFLAGLTTTTADGRSLRSAGMIFFNASVDGKNIEPAIPVRMTIPAKLPDTSMQLFKGEEDAAGEIKWLEAGPLDTSKPAGTDKMIAAGKAIFERSCKSCHHAYRNSTGPALQGWQYRGPWKNPANVLAFVNNPAKFIATSKYAQDLRSRFGSMMTAFPALKLDDIKAILLYLNSVDPKESNAKPAAVNTNTTLTDTASTQVYMEEDCGTDTIYVSEQKDFSELDTTGYPQNDLDTSYNDPLSIYQDEYLDKAYKTGYDFSITKNGWYNVDAYSKNEDKNSQTVKLTAELKNKEEADMTVYLFLPSDRIMQELYLSDDAIYSYNRDDKTIDLPLRTRAILFTYGSFKDKIFYGVSEFTTSMDQHILVKIKETTKEKLMNVLYNKKIDSVQLEAIEKKMTFRKKPCPPKSE